MSKKVIFIYIKIMRKIYFLLYVLFLMFTTFSAYQLIEAKWVRFRHAENLFNKGKYEKVKVD